MAISKLQSSYCIRIRMHKWYRIIEAVSCTKNGNKVKVRLQYEKTVAIEIYHQKEKLGNITSMVDSSFWDIKEKFRAIRNSYEIEHNIKIKKTYNELQALI